MKTLLNGKGVKLKMYWKGGSCYSLRVRLEGEGTMARTREDKYGNFRVTE